MSDPKMDPTTPTVAVERVEEAVDEQRLMAVFAGGGLAITTGAGELAKPSHPVFTAEVESIDFEGAGKNGLAVLLTVGARFVEQTPFGELTGRAGIRLIVTGFEPDTYDPPGVGVITPVSLKQWHASTIHCRRALASLGLDPDDATKVSLSVDLAKLSPKIFSMWGGGLSDTDEDHRVKLSRAITESTRASVVAIWDRGTRISKKNKDRRVRVQLAQGIDYGADGGWRIRGVPVEMLLQHELTLGNTLLALRQHIASSTFGMKG